MRIARATLTPFRIPLRRPLVTARGEQAAREGVLIGLEAENGATGWGESTPIAGFGLEPLAQTQRALAAGLEALLEAEVRDLDAALDRVAQCTPGAPSARAGLDFALHDLFARASDRSVAALLCADRAAQPHASVPVNALISAGDAATAVRHARQAVAHGFRVLKLKLGFDTPDRDVARATAVREAIGAAIELRLDANGAWDEATAQRTLAALAPLAPAFVEQPVAAGDLDALARVRAAASVPVAADESVRDEAQARALIARKAADCLIVKPAALGGLRPAQRIAACALGAGIDVVVTGLLDAAIGSAAALHFAASLPAPLRAAGLAGDALLAADLALLPRVHAGARALPEGPGLGVVPKPKAVARVATGPTQERRARC
ncbi:MAG: o-succinylbenzoate synthase [Myxococcales bacterium]|nr:o-succinylbenzoate synthase [Myxococcales bacterium]MDH5305593.1 o-succinylbenzoate synthase [Myxococcales bacterium]MDH5565239.1 o-succinylbenzoate synthase [Myxococcales bacterium]